MRAVDDYGNRAEAAVQEMAGHAQSAEGARWSDWFPIVAYGVEAVVQGLLAIASAVDDHRLEMAHYLGRNNR